jgi:hypothetical protein
MPTNDGGLKTYTAAPEGWPYHIHDGSSQAIYAIWICVGLYVAWRVWANKKTRRPREVDAGPQ